MPWSRRTPPLPAVAGLALLLAATGCTAGERARAPRFAVLVFTRTTGYRHASIPEGARAIRSLGAAHGFGVDVTDDEARLAEPGLRRYATVVFLSTTGDPVTGGAGRRALRDHLGRGGGFVGVHAAADAGRDWPWYRRLVGATFVQHPAVQAARLRVVDPDHPATSGLPDTWTATDEWYDLTPDPGSRLHVLVTVDTSTYRGSVLTGEQPDTWCQDVDGGRSFYTALGHDAAAFHDPYLLRLLLGGILSTAGAVPADCAPTRAPPP
jgi:cytochrome c